jgi:hypothetical protein
MSMPPIARYSSLVFSRRTSFFQASREPCGTPAASRSTVTTLPLHEMMAASAGSFAPRKDSAQNNPVLALARDWPG